MFVCRACLIAWLPTSYVLANMSVFAVGVWAIAQRDSLDAVLMVSVILFIQEENYFYVMKDIKGHLCLKDKHFIN